MEKAVFLGKIGTALTIIGLAGMVSNSDWQNFYTVVVAAASLMLALSNAMFNDNNKNTK